MKYFKTINTIDWYKNLTIQNKISLKQICIYLCGVEYTLLIKLLGFRLTINLIYEKLKIEGIEII